MMEAPDEGASIQVEDKIEMNCPGDCTSVKTQPDLGIISYNTLLHIRWSCEVNSCVLKWSDSRHACASAAADTHHDGYQPGQGQELFNHKEKCPHLLPGAVL